MHEYSIVESLLDLCEKEAKNAGATEVKRIVVKIGVLSGVEPDLLKDAYSVFSETSFAKGAELEIMLQNVIIECRACGAKSELKELDYKCPECGKEDFAIIAGEELLLMSIDLI